MTCPKAYRALTASLNSFIPFFRMKLILASTSIYRKALIEQAGLLTTVKGSEFDEDQFKKDHPELSPKKLCLELAKGKAENVAISFPKDLVLGSDQLIETDGQVLGKPGNRENAFRQLKKLSGKKHQLHTSLCLVLNQQQFLKLTTTEIRLKSLTDQEINAYLDLDQPYDCAGSYKMEKAGLLICEEITGGDPSAIQGLSLIDLSLGFRHFGLSFLNFLRS